MKATVDDKHRVTLGKDAVAGEVYDVDRQDAGRRIVLTRMEKPQPGKCRLVRKNGYLVMITDRVVSHEEMVKAIQEQAL
jgi:hypothetical protein